ncbi:hypothetical protein [Serratia marcescens]|uniref:hypothetical protein n=1 Tax=Serratia marcescens TaxID=615 RepID=UPI00163A1A2A|nr:hypothetical protein [Serratia marcescens]MBN3978583.1 hypothetical protein [Serratia marcescens]MBN5205361.1 hypothetical protein [Serratia marcescens]
MSLATTIEESKAKRREHLLDAISFRRKGMRKAVKSCLNGSMIEKLNQRYFLGEQPF